MRKTLWLSAGVILLCGAALLLWPAAAAGGISRGLSVCSSVIIPSLFPFLVLGGFLTRCGAAAAIGRRLERPVRWLFGLPGCCAGGIVIAFVGGYPAGGNAVAELYRNGQITREEAARMLRFCVNAGPGFVIGAVGAGMTGSPRLGAVLFAAHLVASLLIGLTGAPCTARRSALSAVHCCKRESLAAALVGAVTSACEGMLYMCGFILLFSALLSLLDASGVAAAVARLAAVLSGRPEAGTLVQALGAGILEVSCGCVSIAGGGVCVPFLLGFVIGFGGLSVHCQIAASLRGTGIMSLSFFADRLLHGVLSALLTLLLLRFIPIPLEAFGSFGHPVVQVFSGSALLSASLLVLCGVWTLTIGDKRVDFSKNL